MNHEGCQHVHDHAMKCTEVVEKVYAFLDGELTLEEIAVYKDHLKACLPCQDYVRFEERLVQIIHEKGCSPEIKLPEAILARIRSAIHTESAATD